MCEVGIRTSGVDSFPRHQIRSRTAARGYAPARPVPSLLDKQLLFVMGKGGVGRTTVAAALPEEMPVNELLFLQAELADDPGLGLGLVVLNGTHPDRFSSREATRLRAARGAGGSPAAQAALGVALRAHDRAKAERAVRRGLARRCGQDPVALPRLAAAPLAPADYGALSERLEAAL